MREIDTKNMDVSQFTNELFSGLCAKNIHLVEGNTKLCLMCNRSFGPKKTSILNPIQMPENGLSQ